MIYNAFEHAEQRRVPLPLRYLAANTKEFCVCSAMPSDTKPLNTVITRTRFLVVVADPKIGEALRRFLASEGALGAHLVQSPVLALRILQDRRTPIDCIVCAHHAGAFSGLEFLANLRAGRWGGPSLQHLKFIVMMNSADIAELGLCAGDRVTLSSALDDGVERTMPALQVVAYDVPKGCLVGYYPECNVLIALSHRADESKVPAAKSVPVRIRKSTASEIETA